METSKFLKGPSFQCQNYVDQNIFDVVELQKNPIIHYKKDGFSIRFLTIVLKIGKIKKVKIKK